MFCLLIAKSTITSAAPNDQMKSILALTIALGLLTNISNAEDQISLTNEQQRISYALGMSVVRGLKVDDFKIDMKTVAAGMADMQSGKPAYTPAQVKTVMKEMQDDILARAVAKKEAAGE